MITLFGGAVAWPLTARAQQQRLRHVGILMGQAEDEPGTVSSVQALRRALQALGWTENETVRFAYRYAAGSPRRARELAQEIVGLQPDVIVVHTTPAAAALQQITRTLPIVFVSIADPVVNGFVASLRRPGGNMTGFTNYEFSMGAKWLEILKEIAPRTAHVDLMLNPDTGSYYADYLRSVETVARPNAVQATLSPVHGPADIERVISALGREPDGGLIILPSAPITAHAQQIIELAARYRLPAIYPFGYMARQGGLVAYGVDLVDLFRQSATYVDRILRGEPPADLPVQGPTKFELVINLRAARQLGLDVPAMLLARADEMIE